jgi:hypothetical protein
MAAGWQMYRLSPGMWTLLVFTWWLLIALTNQVPYVGPIAKALVLPAFMMSFMIMCDELRHGNALRAKMLFSGFRHNWPTQLVLGAIQFALLLGILWVASFLDGGLLLNRVVGVSRAQQPDVGDTVLMKSMLVVCVLALPVFAAFFFAPVLAGWARMGAAQSLFYSFFACVANWRAFLTYSAALLLLAVGLSMVVTLAAVVSGGSATILQSLLLAAMMVTLPPVLASIYIAYRDIFPAPEAASAGEMSA